METARQSPRRNDPAALAAALAAAVWSLSAEGTETEDSGLRLAREMSAGYRGDGLRPSPAPSRSDGSILWSRDALLPPSGQGLPADSDNGTKILYAVSKAANAHLSAVYSLPANGLWDSATVRLDAGRLRPAGPNRTLAGDPVSGRQTRAVQFLFVPTWTEVLPNLDVRLPVALSYSPKAQAPLPTMERNYRGGKFSIGASLVYEKTWSTDLRYMHYLEEPTAPSKDRNFIWLSIQRSF